MWWKVTCWCAVQYSHVVCSRATVVRRRAIIPDNHHLLRTFKTPHGANMSFSAVLLPPLPVRSADDSRSHPFHHRSVIPAGGHLKKEVSLRRGNLVVLECQQRASRLLVVPGGFVKPNVSKSQQRKRGVKQFHKDSLLAKVSYLRRLLEPWQKLSNEQTLTASQ